MAPKRFKKNEVNENTDKYKNLVIEDVLCPICRSIFVEPVTLPCSHGFCLACFNGTMENNALTCPLCRIRIGSWLRTARKEKKVINDRLWQIIQLKFSEEIKSKLDGDDEIPDEPLCIQLANPGEIRREFEIQLEKERSELAKLHEAEEKASEVTIKKILEEENNAARIADEKLRLDAEIARRLSNSISQSGPSCSQVMTKTARKPSLDKYLIHINKKKQNEKLEKRNAGQLSEKVETIVSAKEGNSAISKSANTDSKIQNKNISKNYTAKIMFQSRGKKQCSHAYKHLLLTKTLQFERANSNGSDSGDSIKQEMRYFKPIRTAPKSVPKIYGDGNIVRAPLLKVPSVHAVSSAPATIRAPQNDRVARIRPHSRSAFVGCGSDIDLSSASGSPVKQTTVVTDTGKTVKQYYNKKKNAVRASPQQSLTSSPWFGFTKDDQNQDAVLMNNIVKSMSESAKTKPKITINNQICIENKSSETATINIHSVTESNILKAPKKKLLERSLKKINGCDTDYTLPVKNNIVPVVAPKPEPIPMPVPVSVPVSETTSTTAPLPPPPPIDVRLQEQLDFEYAKRLHEELNNPRTRAFMTLKASSMQNKAKRQVTLEELIPPKKFKI